MLQDYNNSKAIVNITIYSNLTYSLINNIYTYIIKYYIQHTPDPEPCREKMFNALLDLNVGSSSSCLKIVIWLYVYFTLSSAPPTKLNVPRLKIRSNYTGLA